MFALAFAFFLVALLYASAGFGGGSTYSALLALSGVDYRILPLVSLTCNIIVVAGGSWRFARAGLVPWRGALALTALAGPAAFAGGLTPIGEEVFLAVLGACLMLASAALLVPSASLPEGFVRRRDGWALLAAAPLGYIAGLVGIGGGIFLAPVLHLLRWNTPRAIAATTSLFILANSLFGLAGQWLKGGTKGFALALDAGLPLFIAVAIGGHIGGMFAAKLLPQRAIRWATAALAALAGVRLTFGYA